MPQVTKIPINHIDVFKRITEVVADIIFGHFPDEVKVRLVAKALENQGVMRVLHELYETIPELGRKA